MLDKRIPVSESTQKALKIYRDEHNFSNYNETLLDLLRKSESTKKQTNGDFQ